MKAHERVIYQEALEKWGVQSQVDMMIEEAGELIVALHHLKRKKITNLELCSEIADVQIMSDQMALIFGEQNVNDLKAFKLNRLKERLNK